MADRVEQARNWLIASLEPFGRPPAQQAAIFAAHRSDVIEMVNLIEDNLRWQLGVLRAAGVVDDDLVRRVSDVCERGFALGQADEVPDLAVLERDEWAQLRLLTRCVIARVSTPPTA